MNLQEWLANIQQTHPKDWDLGLERVGRVAKRLSLTHPASTCFLIAGTNGKGSTCEFLAQLCHESNISFGKTTSPFFHRYNEQIVINGEAASDEQIVAALEVIKAAADEISLSYFEYGALAAMWLFQEAKVEVAILEIGLGGRLDAMNVVEPDVSIITRIALDHQDWLGDTREKIGFEKAGIMRNGVPVVVLDEECPQSIKDHAEAVGAKMKLVGEDFQYSSTQFHYQTQQLDLPGTHLPQPSLIAATVGFLEAGFPLSQDTLDVAVSKAQLPGRFQVIETAPFKVLDVCHNPDAARYLVVKLSALKEVKHWHFVIGIYADKNLGGIFQHLAPMDATWYFSDLEAERGATSENLAMVLEDSCGLTASTYAKVSEALEAAEQSLGSGHGIAVLGSFSTVAAALSHYQIDH